MSEGTDTIELFFGVYLLYCTNPDYKGRTYIGYTVDPNRRIKQHNKGTKAGGAWRTSNKGPWTMVMIIHGFPNDTSALRFEWAWQHPLRSRRLKHLSKKKYNEKMYDYRLRILWEMLRTGPWHRLPLTVRWLNQNYFVECPSGKAPPLHMPICFGSVISKKVPSVAEKVDLEVCQSYINICVICNDVIEGKAMSCLSPSCDMVSHIICLSKGFLKVGEYVPIEGTCPSCNKNFLWGDFVRKYKGCYGNLNLVVNTEADDFDCSVSD